MLNDLSVDAEEAGKFRISTASKLNLVVEQIPAHQVTPGMFFCFLTNSLPNIPCSALKKAKSSIIWFAYLLYLGCWWLKLKINSVAVSCWSSESLLPLKLGSNKLAAKWTGLTDFSSLSHNFFEIVFLFP